jgi:hypothetical protein
MAFRCSERVRRGALELDRIMPGWAYRIPNRNLNSNREPSSMILLTLYPNRSAVLPLLRSRFPANFTNNQVLRELGFRAHKAGKGEFNAEESLRLSIAWISEVQTRRN